MRVVARELRAGIAITNGLGNLWLVTIRGIHHFGLTVRDVDASARLVSVRSQVQPVDQHESADSARRKVFLGHDRLGIRLGRSSHRTAGTLSSPLPP